MAGKAISGHGISDAVRSSIKDWMTDRVVDSLYKARAVNAGWTNDFNWFRKTIRADDQWKRSRAGGRTKSEKAGVFKRTYYSKLLGPSGPGLTVLTNKGSKDRPEDMFIEYVTITYGKQVIGGGKVFIPSVKLSQSGRKATIKDFEEQHSVFTEFTEKEMAVLSAELEFGEEGVFALLEEERYV